MPELPEVETTRRGVAPFCEGRKVVKAIVRQKKLRWPVPSTLNAKIKNKKVFSVKRRGKYLLFEFRQGCLLIHLGMSGSLRIVDAKVPPGKHDHLDLVFEGGNALRFNDPRRFGAVLWVDDPNPMQHALLAGLGPEPLSSEFDGEYLFQKSRNRKKAMKLFIMDAQIVVGVGNIYANEALFGAGIRPGRAAGRLTRAQANRLADEIKMVLKQAIESGGTTLRDFVSAEGKPGYFSQTLRVYGRGGEDCVSCGKQLKSTRLGQRATVYCHECQT
jgi:formamidopyrimidine-DNA glycosylase